MKKDSDVETSAEMIAAEIADFFRSAPNPILFTGAGLSAHANLPTWKELVEKLAEGIRSRDALTAEQMHGHVSEGRYALAVEYFLLTPSVLDGDKRRLIQLLLEDYDATKLEAVAALPFKACITTNFDRSLLEAIAVVKKRAPKDFRYGDASFKEAVWVQDLFVARIHGAVEAPGSIVLSQSAFSDLKKDENYEDLLRACFTQRNVIFIGFSFYDPAIKDVFEKIDARIGAASPGRHVALLPDDATSEFISKAVRSSPQGRSPVTNLFRCECAHAGDCGWAPVLQRLFRFIEAAQTSCIISGHSATSESQQDLPERDNQPSEPCGSLLSTGGG